MAGVCRGEPCIVGMACCFLAGRCGGEPSRADVACWGGWGPHTPCARQIGPHPPQPTPPSRHGPLRCVWVRRQKCRGFGSLAASFCPLFSFSHVTPHSGAGAHGIARARGEPFRQSLLAACGGRLTPCTGAERSNASPARQGKAIRTRSSSTSAEQFARVKRDLSGVQIDTSWRTPLASISLPGPRAITSPRSITR